MKRVVWAAAAVLLLGATAGMCGDVATVPMGNLLPDTDIEYNYIYDTTANAHWAEVFFGVEDRLEIGVHAVAPAGAAMGVDMTANWTAITETEDRPQVNVGCYAGSIGPSTFDPYIVCAYNIRESKRPPHVSNPYIRGHLGWGWGDHGGLIAMAQAQIGHRVGLVGGYYAGAPGSPWVVAGTLVVGHTHPIQITPGLLGNDLFLRIGYQRDM